MSMPYVTGPVHIYVGTAAAPPVDNLGANSPVYLGTCEVAPDIQINSEFSPLMNDLGGERIPFDMLFQGEHGFIIGDLTVWNEPVYKEITSRPNHRGARGTNSYDELGTLMLTQGHSYNMWLHFPFYSKPVFSDNGMPNGYHFFACVLEGPDRIITGSRANKRHVSWHCMRYIDRTNGLFKLYDHDMTGVPLVPPSGSTGV